MTIRLGDVNFSLGADDQGLRRSIQTLQQFGRQVDQAAAQATTGATQTAAALRKQELAGVAAANSTLKLTQQMSKVRGAGQFADEAARSFENLNRRLTSGQLSALQYQRAMEQFRTSTNNATRGFRDFTDEMHRAEGKGARYSGMLRGLQTSAILIQGPLGGIATRISNLSLLLNSTTIVVGLFTAGIAAGFYAVVKAAQQLLDAGKQVNAFMGQFQAVTGNLDQAGQLMERVTRIARQTGQRIQDLAPAFARFTIAADGTGMSMADVERQFTVVASAATKLQLSADQTSGIFRALEQMMSKGTVQAEELRGQLGDRLAGAVQIAARAMGVTTRELQRMMKAGELITSGFLPKFIEELAKTLHIDGKPIDNYTASVNNMATAFFQLRAEMEKQVGVTSKVSGLYKLVIADLDFVRAGVQQLPEDFARIGDHASVAAERMRKAWAPQIAFFQNLWAQVRDYATAAFAGIGIDNNLTWAFVKATTYSAVNDVLELISNLGEAIPVMLMAIPNAVASMVVDTMNTMIQTIVDKLNWLSDAIAANIPGMKNPWHIDFKPIENDFKEYYEKQSTEIKRIMDQEKDILGDTTEAWRKYKEQVEEVTAARHRYGDVNGAPPKFLAGIGSPGTPFELDRAGAPPDVEQQTEKELRALARKQEAMKAINDELERTYQEIEALGSSGDVIEGLNAQFKRDKEVERYGKALRKAGADTAFITAKTRELADALKMRDDLMKQREAIIELRDTMASSFDAIGHGLVDALTNGEDGLKSFLQTLKRVVNDIIDTWLQLAILNPIKNYLFGTDQYPVLGGGLGDFAKAMPGLFGGKSKGAAPFPESAGGFMGMLFGQDQGPNTQASSSKILAGLGSPLGSAMIQMKDVTSDLQGSVADWAASIRKIESGSFAGNYNARGPIITSGMYKGDRAYGAYQMMGKNLPEWSQKWLGQRMTGPGILGNVEAQDKIFAGQFGSMAEKWGASGAASAWHSGSPTPGRSFDQLGTTTSNYVKMFNENLGKAPPVIQTATKSVGALGNVSGDATKGLGQFGDALSKFPAAPSGGGSFMGGGGSSGGNFLSGFPLPSFDFMNAISPMATQFILGGGVGLFRGGGIVGAGGPMRYGVNPAIFADAPHFGFGGIVGDEVPIIAHRGEEVVPKGSRRGNNGATVNVTVINNAGAEVSQKSKSNSDGTTDIMIMIDQAVADRMSKPGTMSAKALNKTWGLKPALIQR